MKIKKFAIEFLENYLLRYVRKEDVFDYYDLGTDSETVKFLTWRPFVKLKDAISQFNYIYFSKEYEDLPMGYAIIDKTYDKMIGVIDFHTVNKYENSAQIGYLLHKDYWNLGIMTKAVAILLEIGFEKLLFEKIIIISAKDNQASRRVCEKNNFRLSEINKKDYFDSKTNTYHDMYKYLIGRDDYYDSKTKGDV